MSVSGSASFSTRVNPLLPRCKARNSDLERACVCIERNPKSFRAARMADNAAAFASAAIKVRSHEKERRVRFSPAGYPRIFSQPLRQLNALRAQEGQLVPIAALKRDLSADDVKEAAASKTQRIAPLQN